MPNRRNLLIVCCGDGSLHEAWFGPDRSYDILTIYYGDDPAVAERFRAGSDIFVAQKGLKLELTRKILLEELYFRRGFAFGDYAHIWFPDDDLRFDDGDGGIESLFEAARAVRADVFQPAIKNEHFSESWESTRRIDGAFAHRTNIVEIMAFGFSGEAFEKALLAALHTFEFMKSGWGIEPIWMKIGEAVLRRLARVRRAVARTRFEVLSPEALHGFIDRLQRALARTNDDVARTYFRGELTLARRSPTQSQSLG